MSDSKIKLMQLNDSGELVDTATGETAIVENEDEARAEAWRSEMNTLWWWNAICGSFHMVNGSAIFVLSYTSEKASKFLMPITSLFCNWDNGYPVQTIGLVGNINFLRWCSYFALMSAFAHFLILATFKTYEAQMRKSVNRYRWWEYAFSGSLIMTLLFQIWGNLDWVQVTGCFVSKMCCCWFGDMFEVLNAGKKPSELDWTSYLYGMIMGLLPWIIMVVELQITAGFELPWFVWAFVAEYFLCFFSFPINMYTQYMQWGKRNNDLYPLLDNGGYLQGERYYQFLSLFTKTLITWQVASAVARPQGEDFLVTPE